MGWGHFYNIYLVPGRKQHHKQPNKNGFNQILKKIPYYDWLTDRPFHPRIAAFKSRIGYLNNRESFFQSSIVLFIRNRFYPPRYSVWLSQSRIYLVLSQSRIGSVLSKSRMFDSVLSIKNWLIPTENRFWGTTLWTILNRESTRFSQNRESALSKSRTGPVLSNQQSVHSNWESVLGQNSLYDTAESHIDYLTEISLTSEDILGILCHLSAFISL